MKYPFISLAKAFLYVLLAVPVLMAGCEKGDNLNVGYYYITIPGFKAPDYEKMLDSKNEEIRYNAICYLTENTDYAETLSSDSLKGTAKYIEALKCYQKIYPMMASGNAWVSSAAIRFINSFTYNRKEFLADILSNNSEKINVQFEIVQDLAENMEEERNVLYNKYRFLKKQPSWLLQNSAYLFSDSLTPAHRADLIADYRATNEEYKKLLILGALSTQKDESTAQFMFQEWQTSTNERIKKNLLPIWFSMLYPEHTLEWFGSHPKELLDIMPLVMHGLDSDSADNTCEKLTSIALKHGWDPRKIMSLSSQPKETAPTLYMTLYEQKHDSIRDKESPAQFVTRLANAKIVEDAINNRPDLKNQWAEYEVSMVRYPMPAEFQAKHEALTREFLENSARLCKEYHIDSSSAAEFINLTRYSATSLHDKKIKRPTH